MADRGQAQGSLLDEALRSTTRAVASAPKVALLLVLVITGICVALTVCYLGFKTDRADLIDPNASFQQRWLAYTESFGAGADAVVVVESEDTEKVRETLDELGGLLSREKQLFTNVLYKLDAVGLRRKGLQFLPPSHLQAVSQRLDRYQPVINGQWSEIRLENVVDRLAWQLEQQSQGAERSNVTPLVRQADRLTDSLTAFLANPRDFRSPWPEFLPVDPAFQQTTDQIYLLNNTGTMGFLKVVPLAPPGSKGFDGPTKAIDRLREIIAEVSKKREGIRISLTGIPVLENDEMRESSFDMAKASVISFISVGLLLLIGFRSVRHPALAMVMLAIGLAWSFGFTTFSVGHLNILSVSFAAILIGLGIDFGIHYLSRYLEERSNGHDLVDALEATSVGIGPSLVTAALTTSMAFFCATFTQFLGVAELGIIAGGGIILCAVAAFFSLPALIALADEGVPAERLPAPFRVTWLQFGTSKFPMIVAILSLCAIGGLASQALNFKDQKVTPKVSYDHNLLNLQADGLESVEVLKRLFHDGNQSLLFAVSMADSPEEARALKAKFEALPTVARVEELASRLPQVPFSQTRDTIAKVRRDLNGLQPAPPSLPSPNPASVGRGLERLYQTSRRLGGSEAAALAQRLDELLNGLTQLPFAQQATALDYYQRQMTGALYMQFRALAYASDDEPLSSADLPSELTSRFISPQGKWLLQIYPTEQVWEFAPLSKFVSDLRSVDPDVTGTPLQNFEASRQIKSSYETAATYAFVVICLVLLMDFLEAENKLLVLVPPLVVIAFTAMTLSTRGVSVKPLYLVLGYLAMVVTIAAILDFRNLRDAALALVPPAAGMGMMFGVMALLKTDLNAANLIVLPLILGIGVDNGVYVLHDFRSQKKGYTIDVSTANAICMTSLTTMIGFGSMMVASHRGIYSVGLVLTIGVGCCLFVSLIALPALLAWISKEPRAKSAKKDLSLEELEAATRPDQRQKHQQQQQRRAA